MTLAGATAAACVLALGGLMAAHAQGVALQEKPVEVVTGPTGGGLSAVQVALKGGASAQPASSTKPASPVGSAHVFRAEQMTAQLVLHAPRGVVAGAPVWIGVYVQHAPEWHTYWRNSGDSGAPTSFKITLPKGLQAGPIQWPTPKKIFIGADKSLANYGYEGAVLLALPLKVGAGFDAAPAGSEKGWAAEVAANFLVCRLECVPLDAALSLKVLGIEPQTAHAAWFEQAARELPKTVNLPARIRFAPQAEKPLQLAVSGLPAAWRGKSLNVFLEQGQLIAPAAPGQAAWQGEVFTTRLALSPERTPAPEHNPKSVGVVVQLSNNVALEGAASQAGQTAKTEHRQGALRFTAQVEGEWPKAGATAPAPLSPALQAALQANAAAAGNSPGSTSGNTAGLGSNPASSSTATTSNTPAAPNSPTAPALPTPSTGTPASFWLLLVFALLGGLLLNLMPCVLPVLAIKLYGMTEAFKADATQRATATPETSKAAPRSRLHTTAWHGHAYAAGVVAAFVALGAVFFALRSAGAALGWGFQMQNPALVSGLAVLFTLLALNLFGVFEFSAPKLGVNLGADAALPNLTSHADAPSALKALAGSFGSGVLAVVVATPCTAPFMGAALGAALAMPWWQGLLIFAALGLGLALPLWLAMSNSRLARAVQRILPPPGPWMLTFKAVMGFLMLATVVWLVWIFAKLGVGPAASDQAANLLLALLLLAFTVWAWPRVVWRGSVKGAVQGAVFKPVFSVALRVLLLALAAWAWWAAQPSSLAAGGVNAVNTPQAAHVNQTPAAAVWQPWSSQAVQVATASGRTVLVDFTADWCVTCQLNKRTTLGRAEVLAAFQAKGVVLLRADWTRYDPAITAALQSLGRNGVPAYVVHKPGAAPALLPEILTVQRVLDAI